MADFKRAFSEELIQSLKAEPLFNEYLMPDIIKMGSNAVFPAIRNDVISFYYKGGGIFTYDKDGFKTHRKYCLGAVVSEHKYKYLTEQQCNEINPIVKFSDGYTIIKERCQKYGTVEAEGISKLYNASGMSNSDVILLDTEVCFSSNDSEDKVEETEKKHDRIDLLLYDRNLRELCFCEVKNFSNDEIWSEKGHKPEVCKQIARYNAQIQRKNETIITQYKEYVNLFNKIFGTEIPEPEKLYPKTGLLIFGYDKYQLEKINELLINDGSLEGIKYYIKGKLGEKGDIKNLYRSITNGKGKKTDYTVKL